MLLDTHVLFWWLVEPVLLSGPARVAISSAESQVFVSAASGWEIGIKQARGKLRCPDGLEEVLSVSWFQTLPVTVRHGLLAGGLPQHHADPFDRMLVAQAKVEVLTLVARDPALRKYDVTALAA